MKTFEKIYSIVQTIPTGKVATYKQIAKKLSLPNARIVGFALRKNKDPKNIPCHRVVRSDGYINGYAFGGKDMKKQILHKEGIQFISTDYVNLIASGVTHL